MLELKTEIIVGLIFSLAVTVLLAIFQWFRNSAHKEKRDHDLGFIQRELSVKLKGESNKSVKSIAQAFQSMPINLGSQPNRKITSWLSLLLWLTAFFGFCCWAFSLVQPAYKGWPMVPGFAALISAVMTFVVSGEDRKRNQVKQQLLSGLAKYSKITTPNVQKSEAQKVKSGTGQVIKKPSVQPPVVIASKSRVIPKPTAVPEDSTLRRHYLAMLRTEVESSLPPKPTDFNLLRHYETMVNAEITQRLGE